MLRIRTIGFFVFGLLSATSWSSTGARAEPFALHLDSSNLSREEAEAAEALIRDLQSQLPPRMKIAIGRPVTVKFAALDETRTLEISCGDEKKAGFTGGRVDPFDPYTVELHRGLLPEIQAGDEASRKFDCGHKTFFRLAKATLAHELFHVYDNAEKGNQKTAATRKQYERISGWRPALLGLGLTQKNQQTARTTHPYELTSPKEHIAVNFESFLLDPQYRCRRPAFHRIFSKELELEPASPSSCEPNFKVMHPASGSLVDIDPKRVYQVHYLMAGPGDEGVSSWGHSMLRLVVCAPERKEVGPECLKDVDHHLVISYRANVADAKTDTVKGLTGKYPSNPFLFSMRQIIKEYGQTEMRELTSVPLKLSQEQKELLIEDQIEQFWVYSGKYYFVSNNCATETRDAIASAIDGSHSFGGSTALTPKGLLEDLEAAKLVDLSVLKNREQAIDQGHIIPSYEETALRRAFTHLRSHIPEEYRTVKDFLAAPASKRAEVYHALPRPLWTREDIVSDFVMLESQASMVLDNKLAKEFFDLLESDKRLESKALAKLMQHYREVGAKLQPWAVAKNGYGIPQKGEIDPYLPCYQNEIVKVQKEIEALMKTVYDAELSSDIKRTEESLEQLLRWWLAIQLAPDKLSSQDEHPILLKP